MSESNLENNYDQTLDHNMMSSGNNINHDNSSININKLISKNVNHELEERVIWELEIWKRAEQTKFKAYLKQLEYEYLAKLSEEYKIKEDERENEIKQKVNEMNLLQTKIKKKASELEGRENKISLMEEELKIKINEVARQLTNKEDEINYYQKRFKENKSDLEKEKQNLSKQLQEKDKELKTLEENFKKFKKEIDDSPIAILKHELNKKCLEFEDLIREKDRILSENEKYRNQCEKLKLELIKMKKVFETEKELLYKQKVEEVEKLKFEIYNQKASMNELAELQELRNKIKILTTKDENKEYNRVDVESSANIKKKEYKVVTYTKKNKNDYSYNNINPGQSMEVHQIHHEIEKLYAEKSNLLNSGMYNENDNLIIQLDNRIKRLQEMYY
jgi:hypothetical protein